MDYLDFLYSGKRNVSWMYDVWNAFHCPEKGAKSLTAYFMDFKKHTNVLAAKGGNAKNARRVNNRGGNRAFENRGNDSSTIVCFYCHEVGHTKKNCKKLQNRNRRNQTASVATSDTATSSDSSDKIITMTAEKTHFAPPVTVAIADGSTYEIKGSGTVKPTSFITLSSVLNLPNLAFNLISDLMTKRTFGKGHVFDGLYILDEWVPRLVACVSNVSLVEAHCRLGHPSLPVLKKLCLQFDNLTSLDCESCHFAKHHRSSLGPRINKRAESLFELVHSDVWGPCPVTSKTGALKTAKGYRCFSTDLNKYLVSMDVVFSEDTSFFSSPTSFASEEEDEEWLVYQVVNSRPTVGQSSIVDSDASLAHLGTVVDVPPAPVKPPIVLVYSRRLVTTDTCPAPAPSSSDPSSDLDLPISLQKASLDSISAPKTIIEALNHPGWKNAMLEEIRALEHNHTWKLVDLPQGKKVVGCKWVFAIKVNPDGSVARLKSQTWGVWEGLLSEKSSLWIEAESPCLVWKFSREIQTFGMNKSKKDYSVFYKKSAVGIILLVVYVDDIVITGNDHVGISDLKHSCNPSFIQRTWVN
ncbi:putative mitochondrial protein [Vitis vinifera]|uniref:Putative mitochondrial protein n=1 Tax=Vitis vinifera TaxID=29760 RepID=A0A438IGR2_VITVI|nr:putative mitochondrial protein [Vitis vinifera]